ncbi:MAG: hypothetical protein JWO80_1702 [Bryobacterales bacterium]|nr:hypothetical protein [Bryobacterales bacterium]
MPTFSGILGVALASGVNLYATVLTLGLGIRYGWISGLPPELSVLGHPVILAIAGVLYAAEFVADKVPFFTPFWDAIHTFIRPLGAALLAAQAGSHLDPVARTAAVLLSGSIALATHSTKMGARLAAHTVPEPMTHSLISIGEDVGVVSLLVLAWSHPLIAIPVLLAVFVAAGFLLRLFYRTVTGMPRWIRSRFAGRANRGEEFR